jgi:hypothetical protein
MACSGRIFGQNFAEFKNSGQDCPHQGDPSRAIPLPEKTTIVKEPAGCLLRESFRVFDPSQNI